MERILPAIRFQRCRFAGGVIVEFAHFALSPGTSEAELAQAATRLQETLQQEPGFLGRMLVCQEEGSYLDLFYWAPGAADGPGLAQRALTSPACAHYLRCLAVHPAAGPTPLPAGLWPGAAAMPGER